MKAEKEKVVKAGLTDVMVSFVCQTCGAKKEHSVYELLSRGIPSCNKCHNGLAMALYSGEVTIDTKNAYLV